MDYEKAYKEALERARKLYKDAITLQLEQDIKDYEYIFPELKESEDERIRKALVEMVHDTTGDSLWIDYNVHKEDALAWLEKQGEKKPFDYENANIQQKDFAPKQEPKFHEGEWLAENHPNNYARFVQILEIVNVQGKNRYRISRDLHNDEDITECRFIEDNWHPFNIQDAKDGDVLYSPCLELLWIFKNRDSVYCGCNLSYNNGAFCGEGYFEMHTDAIPATKEQHDTLMKAMTDAGWEFDFDKKELKKISQRMVSAEAKEAMYDKPACAWSEEDEKRIANILSVLSVQVCWDGATGEKMNPYQKEIDWLKSLKERCTWKPSDEQMKALHNLNLTGNLSYAGQGQVLVELYNDLKKL